LEIKIHTLYRQDCDYAQKSRKHVDAALAYLKPRLAQQQIFVREISKDTRKTRLYIAGVTPFRVSKQPCSCGQQQLCEGFLFHGEFLSHITEATVKDAVLEVATGKSRNRQQLSCCGSGCLDCPY
jgi:hypothetical protein